MKTSILKSLVLAATMTGAASLASAETVHATIPFAFTANGTAMPAGSYTVRTMSGTSSTLVFENDATKAKAHQRAYAAALLALSSGVRVKGHNYFNDTCDRASYIEIVR